MINNTTVKRVLSGHPREWWPLDTGSKEWGVIKSSVCRLKPLQNENLIDTVPFNTIFWEKKKDFELNNSILIVKHNIYKFRFTWNIIGNPKSFQMT